MSPNEEMEAIDKDVNELSSQIYLQAAEDLDNFIFKTISPFVENITGCVIEKKRLEEVILKEMSVVPLEEGKCMRCGWSKGKRAANYCEHCGQRLRADAEID